MGLRLRASSAIASNISSLADEVAGQGKDWEETLEQRAREEKKREDLGLPKISVGKDKDSEKEEKEE